MCKKGINWQQKKAMMMYEAGVCCYKCLRPSDLCKPADLGMSNLCLEEACILPFVFIVWAWSEMNGKDILYKIAERRLEGVDDLFRWMMRRRFEAVISYHRSNAFGVWVTIIYMKRDIIENAFNGIDGDLESAEVESEEEEDLYD
jgi:hypothetical protein